MDQNLLNYIRENLGKGVPQEQIRQTLLTSGWQSTDVDAAFMQLNPQQQPQAPQIQFKEQKSFLNPKILIAVVLIIMLLLASAGSYLFFFKNSVSINDVDKSSNASNFKKESVNSEQALNNGAIQLDLGGINLADCIDPDRPGMFPSQIGEFYQDASSKGWYRKNPEKLADQDILIEVEKVFNNKPRHYLESYENPIARDNAEKNEQYIEIGEIKGTKLLILAYKSSKDHYIVISGFTQSNGIDFGFTFNDDNFSTALPEDISKGKSLFTEWVTKACSNAYY